MDGILGADYDVSFKILFHLSRGLISSRLFGSLGVADGDVELPKVNNPRADIVARCGDGVLRHVEIETRNRLETPRRKAEYYLALYRHMHDHVEQVLLYADVEPLTMPSTFVTPSMHYAFRILDLSTLDGEPLLASDDWGDNILALLTQVEKERVLCRVEEQLRKLDGEEQQNAAGILTIISGIMGIEESVARRVNMIDIMENKVIGPAIRKGIEQGREEGIEQGRAQGREEGKEEGREEGKEQGERDMLVRLLSRKFGVLPMQTLRKIETA